jgi:hypothetical protein
LLILHGRNQQPTPQIEPHSSYGLCGSRQFCWGATRGLN